jgi:hypothetical protein
MATPTPPDVVGAVYSLKADLQAIVAAIGGISPILGPGGAPALTGKSINDLTSDQIKSLDRVADALTKTRESQEKNIKALEVAASSTAILGPLLNQFAKYSIQLPMQMLSGVQGRVAQTTLAREQSLGNTIGGTFAGILGLLGLVPGLGGLKTAGMIVGGLTAAGGNAWLGSQYREGVARAATRQTFLEYMPSAAMDINENYLYNYQIEKGNYAASGMRAGTGGSATAISAVLAQMGMSAPESASAAQAIMSQGARGYNRFNMNRAKMLTEQGIFGFDPVQMAIALQIGNRTGFSENELTAASLRTGFQVPQLAQAAQMIRGQSYMFGASAGNGIFNSATNTSLSQMMGAPAAAQALMQTGQAVASAASGNDATEMILFQQFQAANPGSSYMDFLEAKTMGSNDPRWKKMMSHAARTFSAMGQMGGLLGVGTHVFQGASAEAMATSTEFLEQAAGERAVTPITTVKGQAGLDKNARNRLALQQALARAQPGQVANEKDLQSSMDTQYAKMMSIASDQLMSVSRATTESAGITKDLLIPQLKALTDVIEAYMAGVREKLHITPRKPGTAGRRNPNPLGGFEGQQ